MKQYYESTDREAAALTEGRCDIRNIPGDIHNVIAFIEANAKRPGASTARFAIAKVAVAIDAIKAAIQ